MVTKYAGKPWASIRAAEIYQCWRCFYFAIYFTFSVFAFTSTGISGKISFRLTGEDNLALRQCRMLTAAVNDNFILEQQCGYNSTLSHNLYDYFHWRKDLESFCTSFNWSCSEVLQANLCNRHFCGIPFWLQYLFALSLYFRLDYLVWYVQILESLSKWFWKNVFIKYLI